MRVVIFTGGTGSIALQRGLHAALEGSFDGVDTKLIVNAYDNGLSTGIVRRVMNGEILGPSDVRKNQATRLSLIQPDSPWLPFLEDRFTQDAATARFECHRRINGLVEQIEYSSESEGFGGVLLSAVDEYFSAPLALTFEYRDFSLANIVYAGLARAHGNSLREAARIMAALMHIPDSVLLNDDKSLFLGAITQSGQRVTDEGEIVFWGNERDPFVDIFFTDSRGVDARPQLCLEAWRAIIGADLVVLSSGTQWSSLIPTYASNGFETAVSRSDAKIVMVMNKCPDKDSPSQTASDIVKILVPRYFQAGRLHVLADVQGHPQMRHLDEEALSRVASFSAEGLSTGGEKLEKHNPHKLAPSVARVLSREFLDSDCYLFDYDDTLVGRGGAYPKASNFNIRCIDKLNAITKVGICSGNAARAIDLVAADLGADDGVGNVVKPLVVYADGGINEYSYAIRCRSDRAPLPPQLVNCSHPNALFPTDGPYAIPQIVAALRRAGIPVSKIENRGNAVIAIKPLESDERETLVILIEHLLKGADLQVRLNGRTTVEICRPELSKVHALKNLLSAIAGESRITFVGDELESGNDHDIMQLTAVQASVKCLRVRSPTKTAFFISTLIAHVADND